MTHDTVHRKLFIHDNYEFLMREKKIKSNLEHTKSG
jgi:hypothetical protein